MVFLFLFFALRLGLMLGFFLGLLCYKFLFIIYLFFQILVQNIFGLFFFFLLESRTNNFLIFNLRVFLILLEGVPHFFLNGKQIKKFNSYI